LPFNDLPEKYMKTIAVILAAGQGTRMNSNLPKVLHPLLGRPLIWYSVDAAAGATGQKPVLVIGHGGDDVRKEVNESAEYVLQEPQLGTGHAVQQTNDLLQGRSDYILVIHADMPLLRAETLTKLIEAHKVHDGPITMLTILADDPRGFGRVIRDSDGNAEAIIEEKHATPEQLEIKELNASVYCFSAGWLWNALKHIPLSPKGEYYLTDLVGIARKEGASINALCLGNSPEMIGINTRVHLSEAEKSMRERINEHWMEAGVTIIDPNTTYIEPGVSLGRDSVVWPNTHLQGETSIAEDCILGPNTIIRSCKIGKRVKVFSSVLVQAVVEDDVDIGPYGHLRKGSHLAKGVHMGNFGEIKNSYLGPGTKMGHFSYIGDAEIGNGVNIGAGTITCNYDGERKHPTEIGSGAFIGSDTMLVAPIKIGTGARTGAGSVVTKNVPDHTLAVGVPARSIKKLEKRD
jgi:bifunctional UDP-N-acetylglucosamine pyrophosphorylase / glucosamine-1-phosphate N-acetyltransferase